MRHPFRVRLASCYPGEGVLSEGGDESAFSSSAGLLRLSIPSDEQHPPTLRR